MLNKAKDKKAVAKGGKPAAKGAPEVIDTNDRAIMITGETHARELLSA